MTKAQFIFIIKMSYFNSYLGPGKNVFTYIIGQTRFSKNKNFPYM